MATSAGTGAGGPIWTGAKPPRPPPGVPGAGACANAVTDNPIANVNNSASLCLMAVILAELPLDQPFDFGKNRGSPRNTSPVVSR